MVRANTNVTLDFVHQVLGVKTPTAFVELSTEHARKQMEALAEQTRHLTGMAQKLTTDVTAPMRQVLKNIFNKARPDPVGERLLGFLPLSVGTRSARSSG